MPRRIGLMLVAFWPLVYAHCADAQAASAAASRVAAVPAVASSVAGREIPASGAEGLIKLDVLVTDEHGRPVGGIRAKDFTVLDNGQPSKIVSFRQAGGLSAADPQTRVIVVIDEILLSPALLWYERSAVEKFLRQNGGRLGQPVSVFSLTSTGLWFVGEAAQDGNALAVRIEHSNDRSLIRGGAGLHGRDILSSMRSGDSARQEALEALGQIATAEREKPGRKLLLWVGPGWGLGSGSPFENGSSREDAFYAIRWFSTLLREARIVLYNFSIKEAGKGAAGKETDSHARLYVDFLGGVQSAHEASFMNLYREVLAVQSGGRVLAPEDDLVGQIDGCVREAGVFYILSFDPSLADHPDEYHDLKVQVGLPGLTARTSTGYYDQPYYSDRPGQALRRLTIEQLGQLLGAIRGGRDGDVAQQLSGLELTEPLTGRKLSSLLAGLHGEKARRAFTALADASEFVDGPSAGNGREAPPDEAAQRQIISMAATYLENTIAKLPNFVATRTTVNYQESAQFVEGNTRLDYEPLHVQGSFKETVLYRNGAEVADAGRTKRRKQQTTGPYLTTYGTFGPVLGLIRDAVATPGGLTWGRWEEDGEGHRAVFLYRIPAERSLYELAGCCLPDGDGTRGFARRSGHHGEMVIDPATGAILRLIAMADVSGFPPVDRSDFVVDYGPVEIGGKTYICPERSVSIVRMRSIATLTLWDESFRTYGPHATMLNDISYADYHIFRGESRLLTGYDPVGSPTRDGSGSAPQ